MDHGRSLSGVFYAGRICHGGDRIYKSEKLRKHSDEEHDGFRARLYFLLYHRICADVRRKQCFYRNRRFFSSEIAGRCRRHVQRTADRCIHDFPDRVLCNIGNDCIRSYGRENQIYLLFDLLRSHQHFYLPDHRTLDLGRRLVKPDRVP